MTDTSGGAAEASGRAPEDLLIVYERDPPLHWQAGTPDGPIASGTTRRIVVDLAPLLRGGVAYAVVDSPAGPQRFAVPLGQSGQLLEALYVRGP